MAVSSLRQKTRLLGTPIEIAVDMVVLGTGLTARQDTERVAQVFGISQSADGFFMEAHPKLRPVSTNVDGIFVAGCCQGPKDIPDTVAQAEGAAAEVLSLACSGGDRGRGHNVIDRSGDLFRLQIVHRGLPLFRHRFS